MSLFLDNAATSFPKPESVYLAMDKVIREIGVAPGRGGYGQSLAASRLVFETRALLAEFFGVKQISRLIFTHSATESLNIAVNGLLAAGDHVVTTSMEHNALVRPLYLARKRGVEVTFVPAGKDGVVSEHAIAGAMQKNTRLVAFSHCSNVTGTIQPLEAIVKVAKGSGALVLVDAAQSAGYLPIDIAALGIDLLAAPGHKALFGPAGTGILALGAEVKLDPLQVGGTGASSSSPEPPEELPERFESGTMSTHALAGLKAGVEFVQEVGLETIRQKEKVLVDQLVEGLRKIPGVTLYGPESGDRGGALSFTIEGRDPSEIGYTLDTEHDICVRVGLHCAPDAHRTIGTFPTGTVRVSPGYFNTPQDIERFLKALH
ncbi:aminotransferase class V-fold PLP-dependent enzyme [Geomonas sp. RF6]|uniref:aminotransferase class V-fold PLP-dependent enzyme n=1 Tax=Geomonas sp. RF6 TaxID=2897342 RepID=UPI001E486133|nr:aminotransferase class V-fold PLP-dependent enzyme [Geomonas sp. RF6]UFS72852.1 aminotransferase class V-fold PLP-dependent enzyme [Geomonas sp. RF6]